MWQAQIWDQTQVLRAYSWVSSLAPGIRDRSDLSSAGDQLSSETHQLAEGDRGL